MKVGGRISVGGLVYSKYVQDITARFGLGVACFLLVIFNFEGEGALGRFNIFFVQYHDKGLPVACLSVVDNVVSLSDGDFIGPEMKPEGKHIGGTEGANALIPIFQGPIIALVLIVRRG